MTVKIQFIEVDSLFEIQAVSALAQRIWTAHFTPLLGAAQVTYMLATFLSVDTIKECIDAKGYKFIQMSDGLEMIGFFSFYEEKDALFISKLYICEEWRGHGYATQAMKWLETQAKERCKAWLRLVCYKHNDNTLQVYNHLRFVVYDQSCTDIGHGYVMDDYHLQKKVD